MIVHDNLPLKTPEKKGFRRFSKTLHPLYRPQSEKTLTKKLEKKHEELKGKVGTTFEEAENVLTTDIWTDPKTSISYLGVSAHVLRGNYN